MVWSSKLEEKGNGRPEALRKRVRVETSSWRGVQRVPYSARGFAVDSPQSAMAQGGVTLFCSRSKASMAAAGAALVRIAFSLCACRGVLTNPPNKGTDSALARSSASPAIAQPFERLRLAGIRQAPDVGIDRRRRRRSASPTHRRATWKRPGCRAHTRRLLRE